MHAIMMMAIKLLWLTYIVWSLLCDETYLRHSSTCQGSKHKCGSGTTGIALALALAAPQGRLGQSQIQSQSQSRPEADTGTPQAARSSQASNNKRNINSPGQTDLSDYSSTNLKPVNGSHKGKQPITGKTTGTSKSSYTGNGGMFRVSRDPSHPRHDPSTRFLYKRIRDRGIVIRIQLDLLDAVEGCSSAQQPLQVISWLLHAFRRVGCKAAYLELLGPKPQEGVTADHLPNNVHKDSRCYKKLFRGPMTGFSFVGSSADYNSSVAYAKPLTILPHNVTIVVSHRLPLPRVIRVAGNTVIGVYLDMTAGVNAPIVGNLDWPSNGITSELDAWGQYDHILTTNAHEEETLRDLLHSLMNRSTLTSHPPLPMASSGSNLMVPAITTLTPPLTDQLATTAMKYANKNYRASSLEPRHLSLLWPNVSTSVTAFIGHFNNTASGTNRTLDVQHVLTSFALQSSTTITGLGSIRDMSDPCSRPWMLPRLFLVGQWPSQSQSGTLKFQSHRDQYLMSWSQLFTSLGLLQCQLVLVDVMNKTETTQALLASSQLWTMYRSVGHTRNDRLADYRTCNPWHDAQSLSLIRDAMACACVPIVQFSPQLSVTASLMSQKTLIANGSNGFLVTSIDQLRTTSLAMRKLSTQELWSMHKSAAVAVSSPYLTFDAIADRIESIISGELIDTTPRDFIDSHVGLAMVRSHFINNAGDSSPSRSKQKKGVVGAAKMVRNVAVIIEPRAHRYLEYTIRNVWMRLQHSAVCRWTIRVLHSTGSWGNEAFVKHVLRDLLLPLHGSAVPKSVELELQPLPMSANQLNYNNYLRSVDLWASLKAFDKVLIFQTDSLLISYDIDKFLGFDYVGAPWHFNHHAPSYAWFKGLRKFGYFKEGVGNGGLSIRKVQVFLQIAEWYKHKSFVAANEDVFFIGKFDRFDDRLSLPNRAEAYAFAVEVPCEDIAVNLRRMLNTSSSSSPHVNSPNRKIAVTEMPFYRDERLNETALIRHVPVGLHSTWAYVDHDEALWLLRMSAMNKEQLKTFMRSSNS